MQDAAVLLTLVNLSAQPDLHNSPSQTINHHDSSGKLTKSVSKQLFKWDAPVLSFIRRQINRFMCSYLNFLCPANELLTRLTLVHRCSNLQAWSYLRWTVQAPPHAAGSQQWFSVQLNTTPLAGVLAPPLLHEPMTNAGKMMHSDSSLLTHEGEREPLGFRERELKRSCSTSPRLWDSLPWTWNERSSAVLASVLWHICQATDS